MKEAALAYLPTGERTLPLLVALLAACGCWGSRSRAFPRLALARALAWALVARGGRSCGDGDSAARNRLVFE